MRFDPKAASRWHKLEMDGWMKEAFKGPGGSDSLRDHLIMHMMVEERSIFPLLPIEVSVPLIDDHNEVRAMLDRSDWYQQLRSISTRLKHHEKKEQQAFEDSSAFDTIIGCV